jgi:hypothetical protein
MPRAMRGIVISIDTKEHRKKNFKGYEIFWNRVRISAFPSNKHFHSDITSLLTLVVLFFSLLPST